VSHDTTIGLISGTGEEGRGIALRLAAAGLQIYLGSRSEEKALEGAKELNQVIGQNLILGADNHDLIEKCNILFLTIPFIYADAVLEKHRDQFKSHHVLVDVTVPVVFDKGPQLLDLEEGSGAEYIRQRVPSDTPIVAAFKTLPAHLLAEHHLTLDCDEFLCSDSKEAKEQVRSILEKIPTVRWIDGGPLKYCRALEAMTFLAIGINRRLKIKASRFQLLGLED